jgi:CHAT domain
MAAEDYLNFELNVEAFDGNRLRITLGESPVGSVSVDVTNPFVAEEITAVIKVMEGSTPANRSERARIARAFGEKLYNTVFSGQIYAAYLASLERAGDAGLRIKLGVEDAGLLEDVPWELLRDPRTDYLALSRQTPVIRHPRLLTVRPLVDVTLPLRVLVMISSPGDQEALDVEAEWRALQEASAELRSRGLLEMERLDDAQLITLQRKLGEGANYQVFHYIGHAAFDDSSKTGMLAFENPRSKGTVPVSGESLARELSEENTIRLVVMNACQGARQDNKDPFAGVASSIVARGLPAVVAMQFSISDEASRIFSQAFYRALSEGYPIETALTEARRAISSSIDNLEWATPVLYLRAPTGVLFPKRKNEDVPASVGGLREVLRSPVGFGAVALVLLGLVLFVLGPLNSILHPAGTPTPSPTPSEPRDVDLDILSVRFLTTTSNPGPGDKVGVRIVIKNWGTTDSGPFKLAWFSNASPNNQKPDIERVIDNIGPGATRPVLEDVVFPQWGTYVTTTWVNFDNAFQETSILNNVKQSQPLVINGPFTVDFTRLPDGSPLSESRDLKGDEFSPWGLNIAPAQDQRCPAAILHLDAEDIKSRLVTGPGDQCSDLPVDFKLNEPASGASVEFVPDAQGTYKLELLDANGNPLKTTTFTASASDIATPKTLQAPLPGTELNNVKRVRFSAPPSARTAVERVAFTRPNATSVAATATP